jgi:hypothetical protein
MVTINRRLNLVIPIYDDVDATRVAAYVHAAPISREVFEANFMLISKTFAMIHGAGLGEVSGPGVAALVMREMAKQLFGEQDYARHLTPLQNEIRRLSNVLLPTDAGWDTLPLEDALRLKKLSDEDAAEVENALAFFTVGSVMYPRPIRATMLDGAAKMWAAQTTSLNSTEFGVSLTTSIGDASSGARPIEKPGEVIAPVTRAETGEPVWPKRVSPAASVLIQGQAASSLPS